LPGSAGRAAAPCRADPARHLRSGGFGAQ